MSMARTLLLLLPPPFSSVGLLLLPPFHLQPLKPYLRSHRRAQAADMMVLCAPESTKALMACLERR